jgi:hypothetical protein
MTAILFKLFCAHAVADYALQSPWMASAKSRHAPTPEAYNPTLHGPRQTIWPYVLTSHALIHGAAVALATGSVALGVCETVAHWLIDFGKCERWYGIHVDQWFHLACKVAWVVLARSTLRGGP